MISEYLGELRRLVGPRPLMMPSASAVVVREDRILAGRHSDTGRWVIPGGAIDPDETPAQAAVRETKEESGLDVAVDDLVGVFGGTDAYRTRYANGDVVDYTMILFSCRVVGGTLTADPSEFASLEWITPTMLRTKPIAPWILDVLTAIEGEGCSFHRPR
jgi:8-oxo-dGTP pyrophosphatase MutT (NUDIX family)